MWLSNKRDWLLNVCVGLVILYHVDLLFPFSSRHLRLWNSPLIMIRKLLTKILRIKNVIFANATKKLFYIILNASLTHPSMSCWLLFPFSSRRLRLRNSPLIMIRKLLAKILGSKMWFLVMRQKLFYIILNASLTHPSKLFPEWHSFRLIALIPSHDIFLKIDFSILTTLFASLWPFWTLMKKKCQFLKHTLPD